MQNVRDGLYRLVGEIPGHPEILGLGLTDTGRKSLFYHKQQSPIVREAVPSTTEAASRIFKLGSDGVNRRAAESLTSIIVGNQFYDDFFTAQTLRDDRHS